ncbi:hypothetical protein RHGRI_002645 [Rhododendron griersonianum]|uniref:Uncharacterized protein n=1 Tax=Rhododendron griersonianum TaxID=479676 RepID=A0AAV6LT43_9ERIC|nr:hypothetical protein RHGRI_002645 [Rhododendron griersonianum]
MNSCSRIVLILKILLLSINTGWELIFCGSCGYPLNLTSSTRVTSGTSPGYLKSIGKGYISFGSIDLSRFTQVDEINCFPIFCGSQGSKTKLLCRKCGMLIGYGYGESSALCGLTSHTSSSASYKKVMIKIRALQPSEESNNIENGA